MLLLLDKDKKIKQFIKKDIKNIEETNNILDCQISLTKENFECDMLLIDWDEFYQDMHIFIDWFIKRNPFVKYVIFYYNIGHEPKLREEIVRKLKFAQYKSIFITKEKLLEGIKKL